jgi:CDP-diacylglycerol--glycerol-3-phosphate 3-phosphatidyltransferase
VQQLFVCHFRNPAVATPPNLLSLLRIALLPLLVYFLTDPGPLYGGLAALTFFVASLTDFFDGYLARRHGQTTTLGKFLDPLADKLIVTAALVMLIAIDRSPRVPAWMVVVIIGREIAVTGLRAIAASEGIVLAAEELGKYKMIFQTFAIHCLLIHYPYLTIHFYVGGMYFLWIALVLGVWSGVDYHIKILRQISAKHASSTLQDALSAERVNSSGSTR